MITELVMLISVILLEWVGFKVWKRYNEKREKNLFFLSLYLICAGIGIVFYILRMLFVNLPELTLILYRIGGLFTVTTGVSGAVFSLLIMKPKHEKKIIYFFIICLLIMWLLLLTVPLTIEPIEIEFYEKPFVTQRTEMIMGMPQKLPIFFLGIILGIIPSILFFYSGIKVGGLIRKKSYLFGLGFLIFFLATFLDGLAPSPNLLWAWRLMYGLAALVIYKGFLIKTK